MTHELSLTRSEWELHRHHAKSRRLSSAVWPQKAIDFALFRTECVFANRHLLGTRVSLAKILSAYLEVLRVVSLLASSLPNILLVGCNILMYLKLWVRFTIFTTWTLVLCHDTHVNEDCHQKDYRDLVGKDAHREGHCDLLTVTTYEERREVISTSEGNIHQAE